MEENNENPEESVKTPGEILNHAREQLGMSLQDVAGRLNLRASLIRDIEANRFNQPSMLKTFVKGYIRSYASLVNVDEKEVLRAFDALMQESEQTQLEIQQKQELERRRILRTNMIWSVSVFTLIVLGLLLVAWVLFRIFSGEDEGQSGTVQYSNEPVSYGVRADPFEPSGIEEPREAFSQQELVPDEPSRYDRDLTSDSVVNRPEDVKQMEFEALQAQVRAGKKPSLADVDTAGRSAADEKAQARLAAEESARLKAEAEARARDEADRKFRDEEAVKERLEQEKKRKAEAEARAKAQAEELKKKSEEARRVVENDDATGEIDILGHVQQQQDQHNIQRKNDYESGKFAVSESLTDADDAAGEIVISSSGAAAAQETASSSEPPKPLPKPQVQPDAAPAAQTAAADDPSAQMPDADGKIELNVVKKGAVGSAALAAADRYSIVIRFSGECWVGIYAQKQTLVNKVYAAGAQAEVVLDALPAKVVVGAPQHAEVFVNGSPLELSTARSGIPYRIELSN
ncbi:MAG: helix-turn-helix domain-containing protein [Succinivibrionaceae bacterium]|nr:helix-turn-helix domain-containing protein [Succinivibrionaceae bacterium]